MKNFEIDKIHWIIQFSVFCSVLLLFFFLPRVVDLEGLFFLSVSPKILLIPSFLSIVISLLGIFLRRRYKKALKLCFFDDFIFWNIFSLSLSLVAIFHYIGVNFVYGMVVQIFGYVGLVMGYANELRNEIIRKK